MIVPQHYFDKLPAPLESERALLAEHPLPEQVTTTWVTLPSLLAAATLSDTPFSVPTPEHSTPASHFVMWLWAPVIAGLAWAAK